MYLSVAKSDIQQADLIDILDESIAWNRDHDLTGCLAYIEGDTNNEIFSRFIQVLEGAENEVISIFKKIENDPRHTAVTVIKQGAIACRNFVDWEMGFEQIKLNSNSTFQNFFDLDPQILAEDGDIEHNMLHDFMKSFYKQL